MLKNGCLSLVSLTAPGEAAEDSPRAGYGGRRSASMGALTFNRCGQDYNVQVCAIIDIGNCVAEPLEGNNGSLCKTFHVHEPLADFTVYTNLINAQPGDLALTTTSGGPYGACVDKPQQTSPQVCAGIKAVITNIGEASATGVRVWLYQRPSNIVIDIGEPAFTLNPGQSKTITFDEWLPQSGNYTLEVVADPRAIIPASCNHTWGCIQEYNEQNNKSDREIPELEVDGISVK